MIPVQEHQLVINQYLNNGKEILTFKIVSLININNKIGLIARKQLFFFSTYYLYLDLY